MNAGTHPLLPQLFRWTARLTGLALFLLVVATVVGQGPPNPFAAPLPVAIEFLLMTVMTLGLVAAWHWEVAGALATLAALAAFNAVELVVNQKPAGGAFILFAVPPLLFLVGARLRPYPERREPTS